MPPTDRYTELDPDTKEVAAIASRPIDAAWNNKCIKHIYNAAESYWMTELQEKQIPGNLWPLLSELQLK